MILKRGLIAAFIMITIGSFAQERPNIILFLVDDLGYGDLGYTGHPDVETPNIDDYAARGLVFTNGYAAAPECSPTRASILTGKYPARVGITSWIPEREGVKSYRFGSWQIPLEQPFLDPDEYTLAEALRDHGYTTCHIGKWHVGGRTEEASPLAQGFDFSIGARDASSPAGWFYPYHKDLGLQTGNKGEYITDRLTDEAVQFIRQHRNEPFFLNFWHYAVHKPLKARIDKIEKYSGRTLSKDEKSHIIFQAMKESVDDSFGRIMKVLEEEGIDKNTMVIFFSDNGGVIDLARNAPFREGKKTTYDGGIHEPMFIYYPDVIETGGITADRVSSMDFYPTILDIIGAGESGKQEFDGISFADVLYGGTIDRTTLFFHHLSAFRNGPSSVVFDGKWKLIHFIGQERMELYDLEKDPGESNDLSVQYPEVVDSLEIKLKKWLLEVNAQMPVKDMPPITIHADSVKQDDWIGAGIQWDAYKSFNPEIQDIMRFNKRDRKLVEKRLEFMQPNFVRFMTGSFDFLKDKKPVLDDNGDLVFDFENPVHDDFHYWELDWCQANDVTVLFGEWGAAKNVYPNGMDEFWARQQVTKLDYLMHQKGYSCIKIIDIENEPYNKGIAHWPEYRDGIIHMDAELKRRGFRDDVSLSCIWGHYQNMEGKVITPSMIREVAAYADYYDEHNYIHHYPVPFEYPDPDTDFGTELRNEINKYDENDPSFKGMLIGEFNFRKRDGIRYPNTNRDYSNAAFEWENGVAIMNYAIQAANAGVKAIAYWSLDDADHTPGSNRKTFNGWKRWGFWDIAGEEISGDPSLEEIRDPFYTWSLLCRYFPTGTALLHHTCNGEDGVRLIAGEYENKLRIAIVNENPYPVEASLRLKGVKKQSVFYGYNYFREQKPADEHGFPLPAIEDVVVNPGKPVEVSFQGEGVVFLIQE